MPRERFNSWLRNEAETEVIPQAELWNTMTENINLEEQIEQIFEALRLPIYQYSLDFGLRTHHTNQDKLDVVNPDNMKQAATVIAAFVYQAAMMDEKIPRKTMTTTPTAKYSIPIDNQTAMMIEKLNGHSCGNEYSHSNDILLFPVRSIFNRSYANTE